MVAHPIQQTDKSVPAPGAFLALLKPITWFPPMWAYLCGVVSVGGTAGDRWVHILAGIVLAGPLICGTSQAVNDWFDRHVDAINQPERVIPSGRMPGRWALHFAIFWTCLSIAVAGALGPWVLAASLCGLTFAWAYSAPPLRLKSDGRWGNGAVGLCYETLPWLTAAVAVTGALPSPPVILIALLYGIGAHGIMTLNDFKAIEGDRRMGIASLPVKFGPDRAARLACIVMVVAQLGVVLILLSMDRSLAALAVGGLLAAQLACMTRLLRDPLRHAVWYSAVGVGLYVSGMMASALALGTLARQVMP